MVSRAAVTVILLATLSLGGGASGSLAAPPALDVPDLRGTWSGTWGGTPLRLVIFEQRDAGAASGIYVGSWLAVGHRQPGVSGVLTFRNRSEDLSVSAEGWLGASAPGLRLVVHAAPTDGPQQLTLTLVEPQRFIGTGTSRFRWGPQGAVELTRAAELPGR
jgi:hypothetical protein